MVDGHDRTAPVVTIAGDTMGTRWRVLLACPVGKDACAVERAIVARLDGLVAEMSHWADDSLLSRFNRAAAGTWTALPPDFATVMARALALAEASGGAFDPAIGALVDLWGFGPPGPRAAPSDRAVARARARSGWRRLAWDAPGARLRQPGGLALDLSGIAKGHAVDAIAGLLGDLGLRHALVEIGGELAGRGMRPDGEPWWVDLENPPGTALPPLRVALHGIAVATSGSYIRGDHNIDPRTGRPPANDTISVSVIAADAATADGWASAFAVLGGEEAIALADRLGLAARLLCRGPSGVEEHLSAALRGMLD